MSEEIETDKQKINTSNGFKTHRLLPGPFLHSFHHNLNPLQWNVFDDNYSKQIFGHIPWRGRNLHENRKLVAEDNELVNISRQSLNQFMRITLAYWISGLSVTSYNPTKGHACDHHKN